MKGISIAISILVILFSFFLVYGVSNLFASEQAKSIFSYVNSDEDISYLTTAEQSHMADVKRIFTVVRNLAIAYLFVIAVYLSTMKRHDIALSIRESGKITIGLILLFSLLSFINFSQFWIWFHKVLFPQGNWQFPVESTLITLFPESFFFWFVVKFLLVALTIGVISVSVKI